MDSYKRLHIDAYKRSHDFCPAKLDAHKRSHNFYKRLHIFFYDLEKEVFQRRNRRNYSKIIIFN